MESSKEKVRTRFQGAAQFIVAFVASILLVQPAFSQCVNSPNIPLSDLTTSYRGFDFGLYPGRRTTPPDNHLAIGLERARNQVRPRDESGNPSANGKIILMSLGMSNTSTEFSRFVADAGRNPAINDQLTILNAALSGADAFMWTDPASIPWQNAIAMANAGANSVNQVQVIWLKQAHLRTTTFPDEVEVFKNNLETILRIAKNVFPNLQIVYMSSRARAGANSRRGPGEPQAYETALGVRGVIQDQIEGNNNVGVDAAGWVTWGPYLWANGTPRSDGFVWDCGDVMSDMIHPTDSGSQKVSDQLMAFFMTAETSTPWFLEPSRAGRGPVISGISPSSINGTAPLTVDFSASVTGASRYFWSYEDGTFSNAANPRKTFHVGGVHTAQLTVTDASGNWAHSSVDIRVVGGAQFALSGGGDGFTTAGTEANLNVGYGVLTPDPGNTTPSALAILGLQQNGVLVSEAGVEGSLRTTIK